LPKNKTRKTTVIKLPKKRKKNPDLKIVIIILIKKNRTIRPSRPT
jgi:hypothetical protein